MNKNLLSKISNSRYFGTPYGRIFTRSVLSDDPITQTNFGLFMDSLEKKGGVVLDAHPGVVDIFATETLCLRQPQVKKVILPIAASYYYNVFWFHFLKQLKHVFGLLPVYRKEEFGYTDLKVADFTGATHEEMHQVNKAYMEAAEKAVATPGTIVVLAPYGGQQVRKEWFRKGVSKLLTPDVPVLFTINRWEMMQMRFVTYAGGCRRFTKHELTPEAFHQICVKEFLQLHRRAGLKRSLTKKGSQPLYLKVYAQLFTYLMKMFRR